MARFLVTGQGIKGNLVEASTMDDAVDQLMAELREAGCRDISHRTFDDDGVAYIRGYMLGGTNKFRDFTIREYEGKGDTK